jgi:hypothetical protein
MPYAGPGGIQELLLILRHGDLSIAPGELNDRPGRSYSRSRSPEELRSPEVSSSRSHTPSRDRSRSHSRDHRWSRSHSHSHSRSRRRKRKRSHSHSHSRRRHSRRSHNVSPTESMSSSDGRSRSSSSDDRRRRSQRHSYSQSPHQKSTPTPEPDPGAYGHADDPFNHTGFLTASGDEIALCVPTHTTIIALPYSPNEPSRAHRRSVSPVDYGHDVYREGSRTPPAWREDASSRSAPQRPLSMADIGVRTSLPTLRGWGAPINPAP